MQTPKLVDGHHVQLFIFQVVPRCFPLVTSFCERLCHFHDSTFNNEARRLWRHEGKTDIILSLFEVLLPSHASSDIRVADRTRWDEARQNPEQASLG